MNKQAEMIAAGIAGLELAETGDIPESGLRFPFSATAAASLNAEVRAIPLDGSARFGLEISAGDNLAQTVESQMDNRDAEISKTPSDPAPGM